ncbi:MAG: PHP domain-containing protein, partial [Deltaproteobacteria bacterium]|nr:PHP domain-containing protein [Deltaproteobacteria bacterium]
MKKIVWPFLIVISTLFAVVGCNDGKPYARAFRISDRAQIIGGTAALADLGDFILENDRIRIALPEQGNSTGPGVFGGSLIDADVQRPQAIFRGGHGKDQFGELFPLGNLSIPALCLKGDKSKHEDFCDLLPNADEPSIKILCDGQSACELNLTRRENADYRTDGKLPSEAAAIIRVTGQAGNYLEALGLVSIASVKTNFRLRNDFILEPGESHIRIRTLLIETQPLGHPQAGAIRNPNGEVIPLPSLKRQKALFGILLGSAFFETELEDMQPGVAGGDFLFFGERLKIFGHGIGFDVYKEIRNKFATGLDPFNSPIVSEFMAGVGENVSYAIASADPEGRYLLPLFSGSVTAGFTHGAHCYSGNCSGTAEQCANVIDCSNAQSYFFERIFAVGDGDVASAVSSIYDVWQIPSGQVSGHVLDLRTGEPVSEAEVYVYEIPETMVDCHREGSPAEAYTLGPAGFKKNCLEKRHYLGAVNHMRCDRRATDMPSGAFDGQLPTGKYYFLAKKPYYGTSKIAEVEIVQDRPSQVSLLLLPPAKIQFEILDEQNRRVPAKLTIGQCFPNCSGRFEETCEDDLDCGSQKCVEVPDGQGVTRCLIDNCAADRICDLTQLRCVSTKVCGKDEDCEPVERCVTQPGSAEARCACLTTFKRQASLGEGSYPPGTGRYFYTADGFGELEIEAGSYEIWASRGFEYSVDKQQVAVEAGQTTLVTARLIREVDTPGWISADFHVHGQCSYDAVVKHRDRVIAFAGEGVEMLSTSDHDWITDLAPYVFELGLEHWVATQVGLELTTVELGHFLGFPYDYKEFEDGKRVQEQGAIDWTGKIPDQLFDEMRELGLYGPKETAVIVAHPRDSFFGYFDQYGMSAYNPSEVTGTLFEWFPPFVQNAIADPELFSGRFDGLELFNSKRFELIRTPSAGELRAYNHARTIVQLQSERGASPDIVERGLIKLDREFIKSIIKRTPEEQEALWFSDGSEECDLMSFCTQDEDCKTNEACDPETMACFTACVTADECGGADCLDGKCDPEWTAADSPCTSHEGVIDDWFRLMDYGVVRAGIGNSDTHQLFTQTEAGCPRNFVRLSGETPKAIDRRELVRNVIAGKVVASYG